MTLAEILAAVRKQQPDQVIRHGRHGITGERTAAEIGMHSLRGGDVVGDHTVIFKYDPLSYKVGTIISLLAWISIVILGGISIYRGKRHAN
jgi:hypothetical protein